MVGPAGRVGAVALTSALVCVVAAGTLLGLAACGSAIRFGDPCLPARLAVSPAEVAAGGTVTVSSPAAGCDLGYGEGHTYTIVLNSRGKSSPPVTAEVARDGSFSADVTVPGDFAAGAAYVVVAGSPYDDCGKDGRGSCAGYAADVLIR
jgi:hypothetical protein